MFNFDNISFEYTDDVLIYLLKKIILLKLNLVLVKGISCSTGFFFNLVEGLIYIIIYSLTLIYIW